MEKGIISAFEVIYKGKRSCEYYVYRDGVYCTKKPSSNITPKSNHSQINTNNVFGLSLYCQDVSEGLLMSRCF